MIPNPRATQLFNALPTKENVQPIPGSLLLGLTNEPAVKHKVEYSHITSAAKTVMLKNLSPNQITLKISEHGNEFMELPDGIEFLFGLPGKSVKRIETGKFERKEVKVKDKRKTKIEGFIPDTEQVIYNPLAVFAGGTRHLSKKEKAMRKKIGIMSPASDNHTAIFGGDDRINIYPGGYPERCVCRIEVYVQEYSGGPWIFQKRGTGFMVGDRIMMSSGHMAPDGPYAGWMIKVVPGYYDGQSVYGAGFYTYASDFVYYNTDTGDDMMACRLYDAIGTTTGYFGAISYNDDWEDRNVWSMCGYPYDRGDQRPTYQGGIPVRDDDDGDDIRLPDGGEFDTTQVESEADEASGASGSPLYSWFDNGQMYAIGVHHGTDTDYIFPFSSETYSVASGGDGVVGIINWARTNWP